MAAASGKGRRSWLRRVAAAFRRHIPYRITRSGYLFLCALVLVAAAAVASANNLLFLILAAMLSTLMISGFVSRLCLAGLELEMALPEHISAREPVTARLRMKNLKWFPSFAIHLSSRPGASAQVMDRAIVFPTVPGRTTVQCDVPAMFPKRGPHQENLFVVATRFPFGFVERRATVSILTEVVIYPALAASFAADELLADLRGELEREQRGLGSDFYRLRPYQLHESARYVDWKSSARIGELFVREFAQEERGKAYIFLDLRIPAGEMFEQAIECCAYLVWMLSALSVQIRFRTQFEDFVFPDQVDVYSILRALALANSAPAALVPPPDDDQPPVLFSHSPEAFAEQGWQFELTVADPGRGAPGLR